MTILMYLGAYTLASLLIAAVVGMVNRDVVEMLFYMIAWPVVVLVLGFIMVWSIWTTRIRRNI